MFIYMTKHALLLLFLSQFITFYLFILRIHKSDILVFMINGSILKNKLSVNIYLRGALIGLMRNRVWAFLQKRNRKLYHNHMIMAINKIEFHHTLIIDAQKHNCINATTYYIHSSKEGSNVERNTNLIHSYQIYWKRSLKNKLPKYFH